MMIALMKNIFGATAIVVGVVCSIAIGVTYGYSLSNNALIALITAGFGFAAVAFELIGYHRTAELFDNRRYVAAAMCLACCLVASVVNVSFDIGFLSGTFDSAKVEKRAVVNARADLEAERERIIADTPHYAGARSPEAIDADLTALRLNPRWVSSLSCTDATAPDSIKLCATYAQLIAERGKAEASQHGTERLKQIAAELSGQRNVSTDDARGDAISGLTGYSKKYVETAIMLLLILFLRFLTALAPFVLFERKAVIESGRTADIGTGRNIGDGFPGAPMSDADVALADEDRPHAFSDDELAHALEALLVRREEVLIKTPDDIESPADGASTAIDAPLPEPAAIQSVEDFARDCLTFGVDDAVQADAMHRAYCAWCWQHGIIVDRIPAKVFAPQILRIVGKNGGAKVKRGAMFYTGCRLSPEFAAINDGDGDTTVIPLASRARLGASMTTIINRSGRPVEDKPGKKHYPGY